MNITVDASSLFTRNQRIFRESVERNRKRAVDNLKSGGGGGTLRSTVEARFTDELEAQIGSDHPGARAQEFGAYIVPVHAKALRYVHDGRVKFNRKAVRLRAKRWLRRAREAWREDLSIAIRSG